MQPREQKALQEHFDREYTGFENFGKVKVSNQKLGFLRMGMNPADLKSIEARIDHLRAICMMFKVSSQLYGDTQASTYDNMTLAKVGRMEDAILPAADTIDKKITEWLIKGNFGLENIALRVDRETIPELNIARLQQSQRLQSEIAAGIITPEEARQILYPNGL